MGEVAAEVDHKVGILMRGCPQGCPYGEWLLRRLLQGQSSRAEVISKVACVDEVVARVARKAGTLARVAPRVGLINEVAREVTVGLELMLQFVSWGCLKVWVVRGVVQWVGNVDGVAREVADVVAAEVCHARPGCQRGYLLAW